MKNMRINCNSVRIGQFRLILADSMSCKERDPREWERDLERGERGPREERENHRRERDREERARDLMRGRKALLTHSREERENQEITGKEKDHC